MDEKTFFDVDGVKVTNARFIVDGQTYTMNNITSVKQSGEEPSRILPVILLLIGGVLLIKQQWLASLIFVTVGAWIWKSQKPKYHIVLTTSAGESKALTTNQKEYITKVVQSLNEAIVHRG